MNYKELFRVKTAPNSENWGITVDEVNEIISNLDPINAQWFDKLDDSVHIVAAPFTKEGDYDELTLTQILGAIVADIQQGLPFDCVTGSTRNVDGKPYIYIEECAVVPPVLKGALELTGVDVDDEKTFLLVSYSDLMTARVFYDFYDVNCRGKHEEMDVKVDSILFDMGFYTTKQLADFIKKYITL